MRAVTVWIVVAAGAVATAALAQPPRGFGGLGAPPGTSIEQLTVLLDLDAYQKQEVERVLQEQRDAMQNVRPPRERGGERPSFADIQAERDKARDDMLGKLKNVLTEQQIAKLKILLETPPGPPGFRGDGTPRPDR